MKYKINKIKFFACLSIILWYMATGAIQSCKYPEMSLHELFIHTPNSFILDFKICN